MISQSFQTRIATNPPWWAHNFEAKKRSKKQSPEGDIQRAILEYLTAKNIFHWRNNTGATKTNDGRFFRFGQVGSPDIFAIKDGRSIGIEVKAPKGRLSEAQEEWQKRFESAGGTYIIARSVDDVMMTL